jgi:rhodanese-related sulfurtransferase
MLWVVRAPPVMCSVEIRRFQPPPNLPRPELVEEDASHFSQPSPSRECFRLETLPHHPGHIPYVSTATVASLLTEPILNHFRRVVIADTRSIQEYTEGHIRGARSVRAVSDLIPLFKDPEDVCIIMHCEFTSKRAPSLALDFRNYDRQVNLGGERALSFPELYLMEGGFAEFHRKYRELCFGEYVREEACRRIRRTMSDCGTAWAARSRSVQAFGVYTTDPMEAMPVGQRRSRSATLSTLAALARADEAAAAPFGTAASDGFAPESPNGRLSG